MIEVFYGCSSAIAGPTQRGYRLLPSILLVNAISCTGTLLDRLPDGVRHNDDLKKQVCTANRGVIALVTSAENVVSVNGDPGPEPVYTRLTFSVERQLALGPPVSSFQLLWPGGGFPGGGGYSRPSLGSRPGAGERYAFALHYLNADYRSRPLILVSEQVHLSVALPPSTEFDAAFQQLCRK